MSINRHHPTEPGPLGDKVSFYTLRKKRLQEALLLTEYVIGLSYDTINAEIALTNNFIEAQKDFLESENTTGGLARSRDLSLSSLHSANAVNNRKTKTANGYNEIMAEKYLITGPEISIKPATSKPMLEMEKLQGGVNFHVNRKGFFGGFTLMRRLPTETMFTEIANVHKSDKLYTEQLVVGTAFCAYYTISDEKIGMQSNIIEVAL